MMAHECWDYDGTIDSDEHTHFYSAQLSLSLKLITEARPLFVSHRHTFTNCSEGPQIHKDNPPSQTYASYSQPNNTLSYPVLTSY